MNSNEMLHWFILGFGLSAEDHDLGRPTTLAELWQKAAADGLPCKRHELLDALYTLSREDAALIKVVPSGEGAHPVSFERIRNTNDWPDFFGAGSFHVKVLHDGKIHYETLSRQLEEAKL